MRKAADLDFLDHLTGTALMSDTNGDSLGTISYFPYGLVRSGSVPTDKKFNGQRLDGTGLYYYGARYYDPVIGRFISADPTIPEPGNPQALNRFSYVINNPLKYVDPSGLDYLIQTEKEVLQEWEIDAMYERYCKDYNIPDEELVIFLTKQQGIGAAREEAQMKALAETLRLPGLTDIKLTGFTIGGTPKDTVIEFNVVNDKSLALWFGLVAGASYYPKGIYISNSSFLRADFWQTLWEEMFHYGQQSTNAWAWYSDYIRQMARFGIGVPNMQLAYVYNTKKLEAWKHVGKPYDASRVWPPVYPFFTFK